MIFGRSNQQQTPAGVNMPAAGEYGNAGETPGYGVSQQSSPFPAAGGYPTQPSGTGYAGYTPQSADPYGGYPNQGYMNQGYSAQSAPENAGGAYGAYPQMPQGYGQSYQGQSSPQAGAYPQAGQTWYGQGTGYAQSGAGYAQGGQTYAQQPQGYAQTGYAQSGQGYAQTPYGQAQGGYPYPQQNPAPGYGAQQGYGAYAQMGRNQAQTPDYSSQIPLNGGGYVPPAVPIRKQPFEFKTWMLILLGAVLAALFAAGLFLPQAKALLWVFIALALGTTILFWGKPLIPGNQRTCYTIIFGALSLVALFSVLGLLTPRNDPTRPPETVTTAPAAVPGGSGNTVIDPQTGNTISAVSQTEVTPTPTPIADDSATTDRLESFFRFWSANRQDEMLTVCSPAWQSSVDNPKTALFGLLANRTPLDYTVEKISGTVDDTSRTVTVTSTIDRNNGKDPVKYRLGVLMVKEDGQWFVDPRSLKTYENAETPDPALAATPTPTPEPAANPNTVLYYNPDGGSMYHADPNCKSVHAKYLPLKGHFTYAEVNDGKYADLYPCNVCAAPLR